MGQVQNISVLKSTANNRQVRFQPVDVRIRDVAEEWNEAAILRYAEAIAVSPLVARVLVARGIVTEEQAREFLAPTLREHLPDPKNVKNIVCAADAILDAIDSAQLITVYTDFDVDGLSGGAQLYLFLRMLGAAVNHYTPSRFEEGYGLVRPAVEKLIKAGTQLLVTVDCGTSSSAEIEIAKRAGMQVVVVDHHLGGENCAADIFVNPTQEGCPFGEYRLCAAGLVWLLLIVLRRRALERWGPEAETRLPDPKEFLDFAALGTICDMVPLNRLNRLIAYRGAELLAHTKRPGLIALKETAGISSKANVSAGQISFGLGPRINAAGRLDHGKRVFDLFVTENEGKARGIAETLSKLNEKRRRIEDEVKRACLAMIRNREDDPAFALFDESFHVGVIGIAAQRIVEAYYRPTAVMGPGEATIAGRQQAVIKGSVRSIPGFHVADVLQSLSSFLVSGGGHAEAGGFSLVPENLEKFQEAFVREAEARLAKDSFIRKRVADIEVTLDHIDFRATTELSALQPFGVGNPAPLLLAHEVVIDSVTWLSGEHVRCRMRQGECVVQAVGWGMQGHPLIRKGEVVSIAFTPEINTYQGLSTVQLSLKEVWSKQSSEIQ